MMNRFKIDLSEKEQDILNIAMEKGYKKIVRGINGNVWVEKDGNIATTKGINKMFSFIEKCEEYKIAELLGLE